ncbi:hypothetical protein Tco_1096226 [Tanacetum coccineum]
MLGGLYLYYKEYGLLVGSLKFVRIGEDYQEYGLLILEKMLTKAIKRSESYQMFIKYSTGQIPPKKSRGKDDNIVPEPEIALELGKSISLTEAAEEEVARQVHATHARIVIEPVPEPTRRRPSEQIAADTMKALKESKKTSRRQPSTRGSSEGTGVSPGVLDESTVVPTTSSEANGTKPGVPDEEKVTSEGNVILEWGSKQESEYYEEEDDDETIEWVDMDKEEEKKDDNDDKSIDLEQTDDEETDDEFMHGEEHVQDDDEETDDEFVHGDEQVNDDEDEEMTNAEVEESGNGDEEITDAAKVDAGKTEQVKDDAKKAELPPTSSSLSVSLGFGDQFLKLSSDTSLIVSVNFEPSVLTPIPETVAPTTTLLPPPSVSTIPPVLLQTTTPIPSPPITTEAPTITTAVPESDALTAVQLRVAKLEKDVSELKKIDHFAEALASLKSQVPTVVENYLGSKIGDDLQKVLQRHTTDLIQKYSVKPTPEPSKIQTPTIDLEPESKKSASEIRKIKKEQAEKQKMPKYTIKSTDKAALKEYDQKSALYQTMNENKTFNRNPANHALYHALMEALIEDENAMDKGVADTVKNHKRQHDDDEDDDEDPSAGPNQGKKTKRRRTKESESSMKPSTTKETSKGKAPSKSSKTGKSATA